MTCVDVSQRKQPERLNLRAELASDIHSSFPPVCVRNKKRIHLQATVLRSNSLDPAFQRSVSCRQRVYLTIFEHFHQEQDGLESILVLRMTWVSSPIVATAMETTHVSTIVKSVRKASRQSHASRWALRTGLQTARATRNHSLVRRCRAAVHQEFASRTPAGVPPAVERLGPTSSTCCNASRTGLQTFHCHKACHSRPLQRQPERATTKTSCP